MTPIYKYIPEQFLAHFLRGEILFRSLSYYRDLEDEQKKVRGDKYEGTRLHQKPDGLDPTFNDDPSPTKFMGSFESRAKSDDIFVFCSSTVLSESLARDFETTVCIEIHKPAILLSGIRSALNRRSKIKNKTLLHSAVRYYDAGAEVGIDWELPDRIAMSKTTDYAWQHEFRLAFAVNNAFAIGTTTHALVLPNGVWEKEPSNYPEELLRIGDLRRACTVHRFPAVNRE